MAINDQNSLLRSAYQIAQRKGKDTNWEAFENNLKKELLEQSGAPDPCDEQAVLRSTCTPLTYRIQPDVKD
jgi:hypothetical protein